MKKVDKPNLENNLALTPSNIITFLQEKIMLDKDNYYINNPNVVEFEANNKINIKLNRFTIFFNEIYDNIRKKYQYKFEIFYKKYDNYINYDYMSLNTIDFETKMTDGVLEEIKLEYPTYLSFIELNENDEIKKQKDILNKNINN